MTSRNIDVYVSLTPSYMQERILETQDQAS